MPRTGKTVYLVTRSLKAARGACEVLLRVLPSPESKIGATDSNIPTRTPMAKSCNRLVGMEKAHLLAHCRLLFPIHRNCSTQMYHSRRSYCPNQEYIFARHGVPEIMVSDNGPQYSSEAYAKFAQEFQFEHITSSPHYPQSNGESERAVKMV